MNARYLLLLCICLSFSLFAAADDANYILGFVNTTTADIVVTLQQGHSSCITLDKGMQFGVPVLIKPGQSKYVGFYRAGDTCHGHQGFLAASFTGAKLPVPPPNTDDYQQFWFDANGGFEKHDHASLAPNSVRNWGRLMGVTVFIRDTIGPAPGGSGPGATLFPPPPQQLNGSVNR